MTPLQAAYDAIDEATADDTGFVAASCRGLIYGYDARWREEQELIELYEVERCYSAPLINIDTGKPSRNYKMAGIVDKIGRDPLGLVLYDHKTTSETIDDPTSAYWRQLTVDSQSSHYELLLLANGIRVDAVIWDVTKKPTIRPKQITKADLKEYEATGTYCGFAVSEMAEAENSELFSYRVARDTIDNPTKYFARRENPRTNAQLEEYARELWGTSKAIRQAELSGDNFRNCGACFNFGTPCKFLGLCSGVDTPESANWQLKPKRHAELPEDVGGHNILTNSRIRTFNTCKRKHYYEYELGIERVDADRKEALYFGTVWHTALDAYWQAFNNGSSNGDSSEQPTSCVGSQPQLA